MARKTRLCLSSLLLLLIGCASVHARTGDDTVVTNIGNDVTSILHRTGAPGAVVAVLGEHFTYRQAYGLRDREKKLPASLGTHFEIGSITKQFTAAAILQLKEAGLLLLDDKLGRYLPAAPHANEVTLRQLLSHTSGLPEYLDGEDIEEAAARPASFDSLIQRIEGKPLDFAPGSRWAYSNTGYILLGRVIELASKETYRHYIQSHLLDRAGMTQTFTVADEASLSGMATGYWTKHGVVSVSGRISDSFGWAAGNLVSTLGDLEKWNRALAAGTIVSRADYALMATAVHAGQADAKYGLGLFVDQFEGQPRIGHTGGSFGFTSADQYFPRQRVWIIALTNKGGSPEAADMIVAAAFNRLYPDLAARDVAPAQGEDKAITVAARTLFTGLQQGRIDPALLGQALRTKMDEGLAHRLASQFGPYGEPSAFVFKGTRTEGGVVWHSYLILFGPGSRIEFGVATDAAGKISKIFNG